MSMRCPVPVASEQASFRTEIPVFQKLKQLAAIGLIVFVVAYAPTGASAALTMLSGLAVDFVDGASQIAIDLNGGDR
jgi:hypothetical protein